MVHAAMPIKPSRKPSHRLWQGKGQPCSVRMPGHRPERPFAEVPATLQLEASDLPLRGYEFSQSGLGPDDAQIKPLQHTGAVDLFMKSLVFRVP
jgi:hypothetical protein